MTGLPVTTSNLDEWTWSSIGYGGGTWGLLANECSRAVSTGIAHCVARLFTSDDGRTWNRTDSEFLAFGDIQYGAGQWIVNRPLTSDVTTGTEAVLETSPDLRRWRSITVPVPGDQDEYGSGPPVAFGGGAWLLAQVPRDQSLSTTVFSSRDIRTWTRIGTLDHRITSMAWGSP
jgi:hypothetical protein